MEQKLAKLNMRLDALAIFRDLLADPVILNFQRLLRSLENGDQQQQVSAYGAFAASLYRENPGFSVYILSLLLNHENVYVRERAKGAVPPPALEACLKEELSVLESLGRVTGADIQSAMEYDGFLPGWETSVLDYQALYREKMENLASTGYGIYAKYTAFQVKNGVITPVQYPDTQNLDRLFGYRRERDLIMKNTEALIHGNTAANMLLYGDAGTGKSSTVKAVANHYAKDGLRLIEVKKQQLYHLPELVEALSGNPLKFLLFVDDLSFTGNDDNFSALKSILEGSVSACGSNIAIYATSNRRHLVKETMDQRAGDELHLNDTLQETMSLAARFGLIVTYQRPEKEAYLDIVRNLAAEYGVALPEEELFQKAEAHAIRANGRSPRAAKQFIELLKIQG